MAEISGAQDSAAIICLLKKGKISEAEKALVASGGVLYAFFHGYESLADILDVVPEGAHRTSEAFLGAYCVFLVKEGRARRAKALLDDEENRYTKTFLSDLIGLLVAIHLGEDLSDNQISRWRMLEGRLPVGQPIYDGLYYNCMLVILVRLNRIAQARNIGRQALESYGRAGHSYLQFFIHLHLADLAIVEGNIKTARRHVQTAERCYIQSGRSYGNERELIEITRLSIDFEIGHFHHIPQRAAKMRRALVEGDSWAEIFIQICRIGAMSTYFLHGRWAAMDFLEDCQIDFHQRHGDFSSVLDVILANINQLDGFHEQAQQTLVAVRRHGLFSSLGTVIFESVLGRIEPDQALEMFDSGNSNLRREVIAELVRASAAQSDRQSAVLRRHVESAMRLAAQEGLISVFLEHREVVRKVSSKLATGTFARGHRQLARMAKQIHKLVQASYVMPVQLAELGVTTQQHRVLTALQSGASNKKIAVNLGLSEATVKFHISNLFSVLNVRKRGELIENIEKFQEKSENYTFK